jgi:hypothetical protein
MKRFEFRLERVLQYLRQQELVQSGVVASTERDVQARTRLRDFRSSEQDTLQGRIRADHMTMDREELMRSYAHSDYLTRLIAALQAEIVTLEARRDEERALLYEMTKRRRVVEELRSRKRVVYDAELERVERALVDEANSRRDFTPFAIAEVLR